MDLSIAWRNLWRNPRRTLIILTAIVIGIGSMVVLSALSRGMIDGMVDNAINNLVGHIRIQDPEYRVDPSIIRRISEPQQLLSDITPLLPPGARIARRIKVDGMLSTSREHVGVIIVGIVPEDESGISFIGRPVYQGRMIDSTESAGLIIGEALLERIGAKVGRKVVLVSQNSEWENVSRSFRIRGTYRTELAQTEKVYVFVGLPVLQEMLGTGEGVTEITVNLEQGKRGDGDELADLVSALNEVTKDNDYTVEDWHQMLPSISAYLEMFNGYMLIWFVVVFIAMGFGIVNTMLMAVYERMREFGLQRAIGMRSGRIVRMVMAEILLLLLFGSLVANGVALFLINIVLRSGIDLSFFTEGTEMWGMSRVIVPVLSAWDVYAANGVVLVLGLLVGLYPAVRAGRFTPVEAMRHL
jgi:ABC-type lipoprotein release transport system permease subunit